VWLGVVGGLPVATMRDPLPPLPGIEAFEAAARQSSFAAAAAELHLSGRRPPRNPSALIRRGS
jgi:hypothetical protein